jgi:hypothetical protein
VDPVPPPTMRIKKILSGSIKYTHHAQMYIINNVLKFKYDVFISVKTLLSSRYLISCHRETLYSYYENHFLQKIPVIHPCFILQIETAIEIFAKLLLYFRN